MNTLASTVLALALAVPYGLAMQQTKTDQTVSQTAPTLKELILQGNVSESLRLAQQDPDAVAALLNTIFEEVDLQITDRKIAEARTALAAVDKFVGAYTQADSGKGVLKDAIKGRILRVDGIQLSDDKQYTKAEETLRKALEHSEKAGDKRLEAGVHNNLGYALNGLDKPQDAAEEYDLARTMAEEQKDSLRAGSYNFNLGLTLLQLGRNQPALEAFKRSAEQNRNVFKTGLEARATLYQGIALSKINPTSGEPIPYLANAEKMFEQLGDNRNTGFSFWLMAQQTAFVGDITEAARLTEKAIPFLVKAGDKATLATCYQFAAEVYSRSTSEEDKAKAEKYKKLAEEIKKETSS